MVSTSLCAKNVGTVNFPISCSKSAQTQFNDALAQVHNMMYVQAEGEFKKITQKEPNCAMAYWGIALTLLHPLWADYPNDEVLKRGESLLKKAKSLEPITKRELAYINALQTYFNNWQKTPEKNRLEHWEQAQYDLHQKYPNDPDATALYALLHLAIAPKTDKTFKHQRKAGKLLENLHSQYPMHPAGYHYTIHAYDNQVLAKRAESIARKYDKIAPNVPHALHMPSHIFVRLGLWPETIDWNTRSAAAAKQQPLPDGTTSMHYAHANDYLMYAYLQKANDTDAKKVLDAVNAVNKYQENFATAYGIAAARARFYLEQHMWEEAEKLPLEKPENFPWNKFPNAQSITVFAKGLGHINTGNVQGTKEMIKLLDNMYSQLRKDNLTYWATLVDSKRKTLQAWVDFKNGDTKQALKLMKIAAELEESVDKHPVTPGEVLPARELYGDMLMQSNNPQQALYAYENALKINPNRYNSILGSANAAKKVGQTNKAKKYYIQILSQTNLSNSNRPGITQAKEFLKKQIPELSTIKEFRNN